MVKHPSRWRTLWYKTYGFKNVRFLFFLYIYKGRLLNGTDSPFYITIKKTSNRVIAWFRVKWCPVVVILEFEVAPIIYCHPQTVLLYHNSSVWRNWDRNKADFYASRKFYSTATRKLIVNDGILNTYVSLFVLSTYIRLTASENSIHLKSLALREWKPLIPFFESSTPYIYIYIYNICSGLVPDSRNNFCNYIYIYIYTPYIYIYIYSYKNYFVSQELTHYSFA